MSGQAPAGLKPGSIIDVHTRKTGPNQWMRGRVKDVHGRGCFVILDSGQTNFYYWNDLRPVPMVKRAPPGPLTAKLSDVVAAKPPPAYTVVPTSPIPTQTPTDKPNKTPAPATSQAPDREKVKPMSGPTRNGRPPIKLRHTPTPIGDLFRKVRLQNGLSQSATGKKLNEYDQVISKIELGDKLPTDDNLLAFAQEFNYPIQELIDLRAQSVIHAPVPAEQQPAPKAVQTKPNGSAFQPSSTATEFPPSKRAGLTGRISFAQLADEIERLVPVPADRERRSAWMGLVQHLYELTTAE